MADTVTPYRSAIRYSVSPDCTVCRTGDVDGGLVGGGLVRRARRDREHLTHTDDTGAREVVGSDDGRHGHPVPQRNPVQRVPRPHRVANRRCRRRARGRSPEQLRDRDELVTRGLEGADHARQSTRSARRASTDVHQHDRSGNRPRHDPVADRGGRQTLPIDRVDGPHDRAAIAGIAHSLQHGRVVVTERRPEVRLRCLADRAANRRPCPRDLIGHLRGCQPGEVGVREEWLAISWPDAMTDRRASGYLTAAWPVAKKVDFTP